MPDSRPLRVGVLLRHLGQPGGIRVFSLHVARYIAERMAGIEAHFLYSDPGQREMLADLPVKHVVLPARSKLFWDQRSVPAYARRTGLDVILNMKFSMPLFTRARTIAVLPGAEQWVVPRQFPMPDRLYSRFVQPWLLRSAALVITHTERGRQDIARHLRVDPSRIAVVPHGTDPWMRPAPAEAQQRARAKYGLPPRFILFLGGLSPLKNGRNLVRAFSLMAADLPDVDLVFAGFRKGAGREVFAAVDALALGSRVHEVGYIDDADLPALYSAAECLALPSWYEGFGIPIIEAMACMCPVVTSTAGCCPEVAGGAAVLVPPECPERIAAGLRQIIEQPAVRQAYIQRGLARSAQFNWETTSRRVGELLLAVNRGHERRSRANALNNVALLIMTHALWLYGLDELTR